jgi:hypothetical protein
MNRYWQRLQADCPITYISVLLLALQNRTEGWGRYYDSFSEMGATNHVDILERLGIKRLVGTGVLLGEG